MFLRAARFMIITLALLAVLGTTLAGPTAPAAAGGPWFAWVYSYETGRLVQVFPDGLAANEFAFPLPPNVTEYPYSVTFSRDGTLVAACNTDTSGNIRIDVYDMFNNYFVGQYIPGGIAMGCHLSRYAFSEDGTQLAAGLLYHYPGDLADTRTEWELVVIEMNTNAIVNRLTADSPQITALGLDLRGQLPFVSTFEMQTATYPGLISFFPVPWATEGLCEYASLVWNLSQNTVYTGGNAGKNSLDILYGSSEATWTETNAGYPQGELIGPGCANNVVMYSNKMGDLYPLFTDDTVLSNITFVDDGRMIAFSSNSYDVTQWYALDRAGSVITLPSDIRTYEMWGTYDGYIFTNQPSDTANYTEVRYHQFNGGTQPQSFSAWTSPTGQYWHIVYVTPFSGETGLSPFPELTTPPQEIPAGLSAGGHAEVHTTEGDVLRVRTGPGIGNPITFQLENGEAVIVLEGPVSADGYNWWRIQSEYGSIGWAVEGVQEDTGYLETLVPVQ